MAIFLISDTHFNHKNIIEYENRPFDSVDTMNRTIINNWNSTVSPNDVVIHLGDVGLGNEANLKEIIPLLNGYKILIRGNHDRKSDNFFHECGFQDIYHTYMMQYNRFDINKIIYFSHIPESRPGDGQKYDLHFFGHVHTKGDYPNVCSNGACLCVERWNYTPVNLDELVDMCINSTEVEDRI